MIDRDYILAEIRRAAESNEGKPLGWRRFAADTGIGERDWLRYWPRWGDAVTEAGLAPNRMQDPYTDEFLVSALVEETRRRGRFPVNRELRLRHAEDPAFPDAKVFQNRWRRGEQLERIAAYCADHPEYADVRAIIEPLVVAQVSPEPDEEAPRRRSVVTFGAVYLLRVGRHYKVGRTKEFGQRKRQLDIQLPERATTVHVITTDDPVGIEAYWHARFAARRLNGEWFALTADDVAAFRRRKFM